MKPPKEKFIGYTDKEWLKIKRVLARVGVDADTALLNQQPLRAELEHRRVRYRSVPMRKFRQHGSCIGSSTKPLP
jgi:hypothetical protein